MKRILDITASVALVAMLLTLGGCANSDSATSDSSVSDDSQPAVESSGNDSSEDSNSSNEAFEVGAGYSGSCSVAMPYAPTVTSKTIQMMMSCSGVPKEYLLVQVVYGDPDLQVSPSTGAMHVEGTVADIAKSESGMKIPIIAADKITLPTQNGSN